MTITSVRNLDENIFREVQSEAKMRGKTTGEVMNEAMRLWLKQGTQKRGMLGFSIQDFGPGTENLSQEIDEVAYGEGYDRHERDRLIDQ
jgi:hypothetical protein